ncbi:hypothetical protein [Acidocella facilis]|uniref:hypothetical protein n=1 Tax=Acidocella facilis TaxID=525 RepID=UPI001F347B0B|nr:hypothetical protein [Acidocella facilis]
MNDLGQIEALLKDHNLPLVGAIVSNPSTPGGYFVPVLLTWSASGGKSPSGKALAVAKASLLEAGYTVDFILIDERTSSIEESLRASLLGSFPSDVRNAFFSYGEGEPQAWIEFKRQPDPSTVVRLEGHLAKFAELFALPGLSLTILGEAATATRLEILSTVRQFSPIDLPSLMRELKRQDFCVPSQDWMNRQLDALRKGNLVLRRRDGNYTLTTEALTRLGTRKDRRSPDVRRILALARGSS